MVSYNEFKYNIACPTLGTSTIEFDCVDATLATNGQFNNNDESIFNSFGNDVTSFNNYKNNIDAYNLILPDVYWTRIYNSISINVY
jgi:uncharacterized membrane protein